MSDRRQTAGALAAFTPERHEKLLAARRQARANLTPGPWGQESPELWALRREEWQMFATLTFADRKAPGITWSGAVPQKVVMSCSPAFNWLRRAARVLSVYWEDFLWALRLEPGELGGRLHYHAIIGGLPPRHNLRRASGILETLWRHQLGYGIAEVEEWDGRDAVGYLAGEEALGDWNAFEAQGYELRKFGAPDRLILGNAFVEKWRKLLHSDNSAKSGQGALDALAGNKAQQTVLI
jgi:hypothetical protein